MIKISGILCSSIRLCPNVDVWTTTDTTFEPLDPASVVTIRCNGKLQFQRDVRHDDSGMVEELQVSFTVNDPAVTAVLRQHNLHWWVAEVKTADGNSLMIGSKDYPASLTTTGSDTSDNVTLTVIRPVYIHPN